MLITKCFVVYLFTLRAKQYLEEAATTEIQLKRINRESFIILPGDNFEISLIETTLNNMSSFWCCAQRNK